MSDVKEAIHILARGSCAKCKFYCNDNWHSIVQILRLSVIFLLGLILFFKKNHQKKQAGVLHKRELEQAASGLFVWREQWQMFLIVIKVKATLLFELLSCFWSLSLVLLVPTLLRVPLHFYFRVCLFDLMIGRRCHRIAFCRPFFFINWNCQFYTSMTSCTQRVCA